ncbi:hypothetical protein CLM83_00320, partial [Streptomyces albidoflavus]
MHGLRQRKEVGVDEWGRPRGAVEAGMVKVLHGVEGTYSHVTLPMELKIASSLEALWEDSQRVVVDRRELGAYP